MSNRYEKLPPYDHALIPNLVGFRLTLMAADGSTLDGTVRRDEQGLHYVADELNLRVDLKNYLGWRHQLS